MNDQSQSGDIPSEFLTTIQWFRERGFHASFREWAPGKTIFVAADPETIGGMTAYGRAVYVASRKDGTWSIISPIDSGQSMTLDELKDFVARILRSSGAYEAEIKGRVHILRDGQKPPS